MTRSLALWKRSTLVVDPPDRTDLLKLTETHIRRLEGRVFQLARHVHTPTNRKDFAQKGYDGNEHTPVDHAGT